MSSDESKDAGNSSAGPRHKDLVVLVLLGTRDKFISLYANCTDTVHSLQEAVQERIGIPVNEQELYSSDKKLASELTLKYCVPGTSELKLNLVYKLQQRDIFRNPNHGQAWEYLYDFLFYIDVIYDQKEEDENLRNYATDSLEIFLEAMPQDNVVKAGNFIKIFTSSPALQLLINLCKSRFNFHISCSRFLIGALVIWMYGLRQSEIQVIGAPILLELCVSLGNVPHLYPNVCRSLLGDMMVHMRLSGDGETTSDVTLSDLLVILAQITNDIGHDLTDDEGISNRGLIHFQIGVRNFKKLLLHVKSLTREDLTKYGEAEISYLENIFRKVVTDMGFFLNKMKCLVIDSPDVGCHENIVLLHEIHSISHLFETLEKKLWTMLQRWKHSFSYLIIRHGRRSDNHDWILVHKEVVTSECRRHLAWFLFPEINEVAEIEIERSEVLKQSFELIMESEPLILQAGLVVKFKDEVAIGDGVKREWFCLVTRHLFDPRNDLFKVCPGDRIRIFPNAASKVEPDYFKFAGRVVALALMHKVHIGIVLDRVLCLQLAERPVSLEDMQDIDPTVYNSCKDILNMDPEMVDQDILALTFSVDEKDDSGSRRVVDLVHGGANIAVDSKNRGKYVDLLIQHWFVKSVAKQVDQFTKGFNDIISSSEKRKLFFEWLESEDLDKMLHGSERPISVKDWTDHTTYHGYNDTDNQIVWFWEIIERMSAEQRKNLLFFWTSIKYLPVEGFRALSPQLSIHRRNGVRFLNSLPISHTCFNQLCFPPYSSSQVMENCINTIIQEHISCSFGTY